MGWSLVPLLQGHYGAILTDPPWAFKTYSNNHTTPHRCAVDHYSTLPTKTLGELPVGALAAKDAALFLWVVDSHIDVGIDLGRAWGFTYKTRAFTWRKVGASGRVQIGMGYWTRKQTELCLLFTKGKPRRLSKGVRELIDAPRREHSRKPDEQYERIQSLVAGPYCELFARSERSGWHSWGNETGKFAEVV